MPPRRTRLDGLKLISQYLGLSVNQVRQLAAITVPDEDRLPLFTLSVKKSKNARLSAWVDELDAWQDRKSEREFYSRGR